jgi:hypothetical protein
MSDERSQSAPTASQSQSAPITSDKIDLIALREFARYNPAAERPNVWRKIRNYAGGTLCLVEFYYAGNEGRRQEWSVLVRGQDDANVFPDYEQALREASTWRSWLSNVSSPDVVVALLSFIIVISCIGIFLWQLKLDDPLRSALTLVVGFWFGKLSMHSTT